MQHYTVYLYLETVVSGGTSTHYQERINCIYSIWYLSHRYCYLPLSWKNWNRFECAVDGVRHPQHTQTGELILFQYISNKMQSYTVYLYLETALHVSGGNSTHFQERIQLYLQHLVFVTPLLLSAAIVEELEPV
jgi:hypothetical protein